MMENYRLQFITHCNDRYTYIDSARVALEGGCRWVQLRMKDASEALLRTTALEVQRMCADYGATFIIDDNVALVADIGADGVHLGKHDMPIAEARAILGERYIIGGTVNTFEDITRTLTTATPDYFGCGPFRFTSTKKNLAPTLGIDGYSNIIAKMREQGIATPIVAIGGITRGDIPELLRSGIGGIALSSSILNASDPVREMREIVRLVRESLNEKL